MDKASEFGSEDWGFESLRGHFLRTSLVAQMVKYLSTMQETWVLSLGWKDPVEKEMANHLSTIAWKIPWTEGPGRLQSMGSQRVGHDWATSLFSPVLLPGNSHRWKSLVGYSPWRGQESDMTEQLHFLLSFIIIETNGILTLSTLYNDGALGMSMK